MASTGPNSPSTVANAGTGVDWTNPTNITSADSSNATVFLEDGNTVLATKYLRATGFGFNVPSGATINGVVVEYLGSNSSSDGHTTEVKLVKGGTEAGTAKTNGDASSAPSYNTFGTSSDLWGNTLTDSDVNGSGFGVSMKCSIGSLGGNTFNGSVDHVRLTVHYTEGGSATHFLSLLGIGT